MNKLEISKSALLKKYEKVYIKCLKKITDLDYDINTRKKSRRVSTRIPKHTPKHTSKHSPKHSPKKKLTSYQKYVKSESKKEIYHNISPKSRMKSIGHSWIKRK